MDSAEHPEPHPFKLPQAESLWTALRSLAEATYHLDKARDALLMIETANGSPLATASVDILHHAARSLLHETGQAMAWLRFSADPEVAQFANLILHRFHASPTPAPEPAAEEEHG